MPLPGELAGMKPPHREMWADRAFAFLDGDDPATQLSKVRVFGRIIVLIVCTEYWARAIPKWHDLGLDYWVTLFLLSTLAAAALSVGWSRVGFAGLALTQAVRIWSDFPGVGNHCYLELLLCVLSAALDVQERDERQLFLRAVRWMVCVVFFCSGLQKLIHGYYFRGQLLAYSIAKPMFQPILGLLLPHDEFVRLSGYHARAGDGPYLVSSALFVVVSNATYVVEMGLAALLALRRTRQIAVVGAVAFLIGVESAAREFFFGLVFINMLLLFLPSDFNRRLLSVFAGVLAALLLVRLKVLPEVSFF